MNTLHQSLKHLFKFVLNSFSTYLLLNNLNYCNIQIITNITERRLIASGLRKQIIFSVF